MKRFFIFALALLMVLSLFACGKKDEKEAAAPEPAVTEAPAEPEPAEEPAATEEKGIEGAWVATMAEAQGLSMKASDIGLDVSFEFRNDGTVAITANGQTETDQYTLSGNDLSIIDATSTINGVYDPAADTIVVETDGVKITIERKSADGAVEPAEEPAAPVDADPSDIAGTWTLTKGLTSGVEIPVGMLNMSLSFRFNEDGTASMIYDGTTTNGLNWELQDGLVALSAHGQKIYDFSYDGTMLSIDQPGVTLCFEKEN